MAHDPASLTIAPAAWGPHSEHWLSLALAGATLADLKRQHEAGAALFHILAGAECCGAFLLRVEDSARGPVGVIVAAAMQLAGVDAIASVLPHIERLFVGVRSIRYHTRNPALARRLARCGYAAAEIVAFKELQ